MSPDASSAHVALAETLVGQLHGLLEMEFDALKTGTMEPLDALQGRKMALLEQLAQLAPGQLPEGEELPAAWRPFAEKARACRLLHQRNETLVTRKLDAVRGALSSLQVATEGLIEETYDRSGRLDWPTGRRRARNAYQDV